MQKCRELKITIHNVRYLNVNVQISMLRLMLVELGAAHFVEIFKNEILEIQVKDIELDMHLFNVKILSMFRNFYNCDTKIEAEFYDGHFEQYTHMMKDDYYYRGKSFTEGLIRYNNNNMITNKYLLFTDSDIPEKEDILLLPAELVEVNHLVCSLEPGCSFSIELISDHFENNLLFQTEYIIKNYSLLDNDWTMDSIIRREVHRDVVVLYYCDCYFDEMDREVCPLIINRALYEYIKEKCRYDLKSFITDRRTFNYKSFFKWLSLKINMEIQSDHIYINHNAHYDVEKD